MPIEYNFLPGQTDNLPDLFDAFTLSMSLPLLSTSYRAHAQAQMEVLRRARGYRWAAWSSPSMAEPTAATTAPAKTVPAFSQTEEQWSIPAGSYLWGWSFAVLSGAAANFYIQLTDACTETALFADYVNGNIFTPGATPVRGPSLLTTPRLISDPGKVNVEIYNNTSVDINAQFVGYFAIPIPLPPGLQERELGR
jgi:hypothetical protein